MSERGEKKEIEKSHNHLKVRCVSIKLYDIPSIDSDT